MNTADYIAFVALILNVFLGLIFPTFQRPMLAVETQYYDYNSFKKLGLVKYDLIISNIGLVPLHQVIGSIDALSVNITSIPYISKYLYDYSDNQSKSLFEIDFLPANSKITAEVIAKAPKNNNSLIPTSYVFSKEISAQPLHYIYLFNILIIASIISFIVLLARLLNKM